MKYRLKDRALQKQLDAITNGDFSEKLNTEAQKMFSPVLAREVFRVYFGDFDALANRFSVLFELDEIEEATEYNPNGWNEWPSVEPPEKTRLRIEVITERIGEGTPEPSGGKVRLRGCATFSHGFWMLGEKITVKPRETVRFRPWIDPDEEDSK